MSSSSRFVLTSSIGAVEFVPNDAFKQLPEEQQITVAQSLKSGLGTTLSETAESVNPKQHSDATHH